MTATKAARSAARFSAIMTGVAYATSAEMASELGAFAGYDANADAMLRVMRNHRRAAYGAASATRTSRSRRSRSIMRRSAAPEDARRPHAKAAWDEAVELGEMHGFRNAQVSVIAPTGTIGLVMDCDTTGIEPDFALVKFKKLAGGGYFKIINRAVPEGAAHARLWRSARSTTSSPMPSGARTLEERARDQSRTLQAKGFTRGEARRARGDAAERLRHQIRLQQMDAWRGVSAPDA